MNVDPSGHFLISFLAGLGIATLVGAVAGAATYTIGQVIEFVSSGTFEWSFGGFFGSIIGGAIGGLVSYVIPGIGTSLGVAISGIFTTAGTMIGQNLTGDSSYSILEILVESFVLGLISGAFAGILTLVKIPKINSGRGSFSAISKQIFTKFKRGLINKVTLKTFGKIFAVDSYYGSLGNIFDWILNCS